MKKIAILISMLILFSITVVATDIYREPYSTTFSTESEIGKTIPTIISELNTKSCYNKENWGTKYCNYVYYCYAILPSTSTDLKQVLQKNCIDITEKSTVSLQIIDFVPPKGILYYVTSFIVVVNAECTKDTCTSSQWTYNVIIPELYIRAHSIRNVCPEGQMLNFDINAGEYKCFIAKRVCLDTLKTGLCTNVYNIWALDMNEDGVVSEKEKKSGSSLCADRPLDINNDGIFEYQNGDGICDMVRDLECLDNCKKYTLDSNGNLECTSLGSNGLCDEWDKASWFSCDDDVLSPNSKICDNIDSNLCNTNYNPVCVGGRGGITYPNECFAKASGQNIFEKSSCEPAVIQCYIPEDCPELNVCLGGSTSGISKMCLANRCSYTGACGNLACNTNADCLGLGENICVGMYASCNGGVCTIDGNCLEPPTQNNSWFWEMITQIWSKFVQIVKNLLS